MNIRSRMGVLRATAGVLFLLVCSGIHAADTSCPGSAFLRGMLLEDLKASVARMRIDIGPLRDGRTLHVEGTFLDLHGAGDAMTRKVEGNTYRMDVDRLVAVKSVLVFDAWYLCERGNEPVCRLLLRYVAELSGARAPAQLLFVDQRFGLDAAAACRLREGKAYPTGLLETTQTSLRDVMLHEFGHDVLGVAHPASTARAASYRSGEAEADGFASAVVRTARIAPAISLPLLLQVMSPAAPLDQAHPPAWCRLDATFAAVSAWRGANTAEGSAEPPRYRLTDIIGKYGGPFPQLRGFASKSAIDCSDYARDYAHGMLLAALFVDENTSIEPVRQSAP